MRELLAKKKSISNKLAQISAYLAKKETAYAHKVCMSLIEDIQQLSVLQQTDVYYSLGEIYEQHKIYAIHTCGGSAQTYYLRVCFLLENETYSDANRYGRALTALDRIEEKLVTQLTTKTKKLLFPFFFSLFSLYPKSSSYFREYHALRREYAESMKALSSYNESRKVYAQNIKKLLKEILSRVAEQLGSPPCNYDVISFGSLVRSDLGPYSDIDCALIIEDEEKKGDMYFTCFIELYGFYLRGMCGSWVVNDNFIQYVGLHLDDGDVQQATSREGMLQQTPSSLSDWVVEPIYGFYDMHWCYQSALLRSTCLFSSQGDEGLWKTYQSSLFEKLSRSSSVDMESRAHQLLGLELLRRDQQDYLAAREDFDEKRPSIVNLKKDFLSPLIAWCMNMGLYLGLREKNETQTLLSDVAEIIEACIRLRCFDEELLDGIKNSVGWLQILRSAYQVLREGQPDLVRMPEGWCKIVSMDAGIPMLSQEEAAMLYDLKEQVLFPLYSNNCLLEVDHETFNLMESKTVYFAF